MPVFHSRISRPLAKNFLNEKCNSLFFQAVSETSKTEVEYFQRVGRRNKFFGGEIIEWETNIRRFGFEFHFTNLRIV
jgi:hypothetical protein